MPHYADGGGVDPNLTNAAGIGPTENNFVGDILGTVGQGAGNLFGSIRKGIGEANPMPIFNGQTVDFTQPTVQQLGSTGQLQNAYGQAQGGLGQYQQFANQAGAQNGFGNQASVYAQQQGLANQLQEQANGGGPNPALAQLQQATGQNAAMQAALMGSQRGSNANAGLIARQASQQGGALQQQAAGQAAVLQAQQQVAARQQLQQQQAAMAGLASQQVGQQASALGGYNQLAQGMYGSQLGALGQQNAQNIQAGLGTQGMQLSQAQGLNTIQGGLLGQNTAANANILGGGLGGLGSALGMGKAHGGEIENMKMGGHVPGQAQVRGDSLKNDTVHAMLSPGEIVIPRTVAQSGNPAQAAAQFVEKVKGRAQRHYSSGGMIRNYAEGDEVAPEPFFGAPRSIFAEQQAQAAPMQQDQSQSMQPQAQPQDTSLLARLGIPQGAPQDTADVQAPASKGYSLFGQQQQPQQEENPYLSMAGRNAGLQQEAYRGQVKGITDTANVEGQIGAALQGIAKTAQGDIAAFDDPKTAENIRINRILDDTENVAKNHMNINPNALWENKSVPGKVSTALGLILGGIGSGLTGGPNMAMEFLNKQIDRDVQSQQANMNNQSTLLGHNLKLLGNLQDAKLKTKADKYKILEYKVAEIANQFKGPEAEAKKQMLLSQLKAQSAGLLSQIGPGNTFMGQPIQPAGEGAQQPGQQGAPQVQTNPELHPILRKHINPDYVLPMLYQDPGERKEAQHDLKEAQDSAQFRVNALNAFDQIAKENTLLNLANPQAQARMNAKMNPLLLALGRGEAGKFSEVDLPIIQSMFSKPWTSNYTNQDLRQNLDNHLRQKMNWNSLYKLGPQENWLPQPQNFRTDQPFAGRTR